MIFDRQSIFVKSNYTNRARAKAGKTGPILISSLFLLSLDVHVCVRTTIPETESSSEKKAGWHPRRVPKSAQKALGDEEMEVESEEQLCSIARVETVQTLI